MVLNEVIGVFEGISKVLMGGFGSGFEFFETLEVPFEIMSFGFEVKFQLVAVVEDGELDDFKKLLHWVLSNQKWISK